MKTSLLPLRIVLGMGILLMAAFSALPLIPHRVISADAPATLFSAERAMTDLAVIAKEPHGAGSDEQERVREYIIAQVGALGMSADIQASGSFSNILVRIPGTDATGTILVTGHYDSHPPAPGAGDDGISNAAMLEAIRVLHANPPLRNEVLFLFTDGEELGWIGASTFIREHPETMKESILLCFDARPGNAPLLLQETSPGDAWLVRQMAGLPISAWAASWKRDQERTEQDTDFDTFQPAGFSGMVFENEANGTRYHTNRDTVDAISPNLVQAYGETMLTLIGRFGTVDLLTRTSGSDLNYVSLPLVGLVAYPDWVMSILNGLAFLCVFGFVIVGWRMHKFSPGRFLLSVIGLLIGIALIVLFSQMTWGIILKKKAAEAVAGVGFEASTQWISILMAGAVFLMILILSVLSRRLGGMNGAVAALAIFLTVGFTFYFLDAIGNPFRIGWFAWSVLGCVPGLGILVFAERPLWKVVLLLCSAFPILIIAVPYFMLATYTREDAWLPVLVVAAWAGLFAPQADAIFGHGLNQVSQA